MRIRTNVSAINTTRNHGIVQGNLNKSLEKLSSGYQINRAGDNAAGLTLSERMRSQISGLDQAVRNTDDSIGMANTGEGALQEVHSMLHRLKTLATESANGTYDDIARANIDSERGELLNEIDRIAGSTNFDGVALFDNTDQGPAVRPLQPKEKDEITLQIGATDAETMPMTRYYLGSKVMGLDYLDFNDQTKANESIDILDEAIDVVTKMRSSFGSNSVHLQHTKNSLGVTSENINNAESAIRDTDMTAEMTRYTSANIISQSAQAMMAQANQMPQIVLNIIQQ